MDSSRLLRLETHFQIENHINKNVQRSLISQQDRILTKPAMLFSRCPARQESNVLFYKALRTRGINALKSKERGILFKHNLLGFYGMNSLIYSFRGDRSKLPNNQLKQNKRQVQVSSPKLACTNQFRYGIIIK